MRPDRAGLLDLAVENRTVTAGQTVVVAGRVTNRSPVAEQVVLLVQGLPSAWSPPVQVLLLPEDNTANVFLYLTPPVGFPPGRYRWALTAQTADRPMRAATAELTVHRPRRDPSPTAFPRRRRRRWVAPMLLAGLLSTVVLARIALRSNDLHPNLLRPALTADPSESWPADVNQDFSGPVTVQGTVYAAGCQQDTPIRYAVYHLDPGSLTMDPEAPPPRRIDQEIQIQGVRWTAALETGWYKVTFSQAGCVPDSVLVQAAFVDALAIRPARLRPGPRPS